MDEKQRKLNALKGLKDNIESLIQNVQETSNENELIDQLLDDLMRIINEIKELETK